jgi:hypothetical protein
MNQRLRSGKGFNPEKFLAAEEKKKRRVFVPAGIVLAEDYKKHLYQQMDEAGIGFESGSRLDREFLKAALAKYRIKLGEQVFEMLLQDLRLGLIRRHLGGKPGDGAAGPA